MKQKALIKIGILFLLFLSLIIGVNLWALNQIDDNTVTSTTGNSTTYKGEGDPTATDFDKIQGLTGNVQTQINSKEPKIEDVDTGVPSYAAGVRTVGVITTANGGTGTDISINNGVMVVEGGVPKTTTTLSTNEINLANIGKYKSQAGETGIVNINSGTMGSQSSPTSAELAFLGGASSNVQTQINTKANLQGGNSFTGNQVISGNLNASTLGTSGHSAMGSNAYISPNTILSVEDTFSTTGAKHGLILTVHYDGTTNNLSGASVSGQSFFKGSNITGNIKGGISYCYPELASTTTSATMDVYGYKTFGMGNFNATVDIKNSYGLVTSVIDDYYGGTLVLDNGYGLKILQGTISAGTVTMDNMYQLFIDKPTQGTNNYQVFLEGVGAGTGIFLNGADTGVYSPIGSAVAIKSGGVNVLTVSNTGISITKPIVLVPSATQSITTSGSTAACDAAIVILNPDGNYTNIGVSAGSAAGQTLLITLPNGEANTVTLIDAPAYNFNLGGDRALGAEDTLFLIYNGTLWIEVAYANN